MIFRAANIDDSDDLLNWRNDPLTRKMSIQQDMVKAQDHMQWFERALSNDDIILYIAEQNGDKLGIVRFDRDGTKTNVSINLNPDHRGNKLAFAILNGAINQLKETWNIKTIKAIIRNENIASQKLFEKSGFNRVSSQQNLHNYVKND